MRYEGNVYEGCLQQYDFDHDIALVHVMMCLHVNAMYFGDVESPPYSKVVAVGRDISGKLMATSGILTSDSSGSEDCEDIMLSTCKISEVHFLYSTSSSICILEAVTLVAYHFILFQCNSVASHLFLCPRLGEVGHLLILMGTLLA